MLNVKQDSPLLEMYRRESEDKPQKPFEPFWFINRVEASTDWGGEGETNVAALYIKNEDMVAMFGVAARYLEIGQESDLPELHSVRINDTASEWLMLTPAVYEALMEYEQTDEFRGYGRSMTVTMVRDAVCVKEFPELARRIEHEMFGKRIALLRSNGITQTWFSADDGDNDFNTVSVDIERILNPEFLEVDWNKIDQSLPEDMSEMEELDVDQDA